MKKYVLTAGTLVTLLTIGFSFCGCSPSTAPSPSMAQSIIGPHGSAALPLGEGKGYVEVLLERQKGTKKVAGQPALVAYFLNDDGKTPVATLPSSVEASLQLPGNDSLVSVQLQPEPLPSDRVGAARFASEPGDLDYDQIMGKLTATLGGEVITVEFGLY